MVTTLTIDEFDVQQEFKGRDGKIYAQIGFKKGTMYEGFTTKVPYYNKEKVDNRNNIYKVSVSDSFVFHLRKATYDDQGNDKEERVVLDADTLSKNIQAYREDYMEANRVTIDADTLFRTLDRGSRYFVGYVENYITEDELIEKHRIQAAIIQELDQHLNPRPRQQVNMIDIYHAKQALETDDAKQWGKEIDGLYWQITSREQQNIAYHRTKIAATPEEKEDYRKLYEIAKELNGLFRVEKKDSKGHKL